MLSENGRQKKFSKEQLPIYERVWDIADYVIPPSENNAFFVMTNAVITPNQTRSTCPEDHTEMPDTICNNEERLETPTKFHLPSHHQNKSNPCIKGRIRYYTSHGSETGRCVKHDRTKRVDDVHVCEISGWCPVEQDTLLIDDEPLIPNTEYFTVLIKNAISFAWFHPEKYRRNNMPIGICMFNPNNPESWLCPIFRLGDIVGLAGGNITFENSFDLTIILYMSLIKDLPVTYCTIVLEVQGISALNLQN